ncbi:hypothetical protein ACJQWK_04962 [Exserohilum turcicum]
MEDNEPEDPWITMLRLEEEICEQEIRDFATRTPQPMSNDELLASLREGEERESWRPAASSAVVQVRPNALETQHPVRSPNESRAEEGMQDRLGFKIQFVQGRVWDRNRFMEWVKVHHKQGSHGEYLHAASIRLEEWRSTGRDAPSNAYVGYDPYAGSSGLGNHGGHNGPKSFGAFGARGGYGAYGRSSSGSFSEYERPREGREAEMTVPEQSPDVTPSRARRNTRDVPTAGRVQNTSSMELPESERKPLRLWVPDEQDTESGGAWKAEREILADLLEFLKEESRNGAHAEG